MSKRRNTKMPATQATNSSQHRPTKAPQLELPDGYAAPSKHNSASKKNKKRRGRGSNTMSSPTSTCMSAGVVPGFQPTPPPTPPSSRKPSGHHGDNLISLQPWAYDPENFASPLDNGELLFNYNREWKSLGKAPEEEFFRELRRGKRSLLPTMFPDNTYREVKLMRPKFESAHEMVRGKAMFDRWSKINQQREPDTPCGFKLWGACAEGTVISGLDTENDASILTQLFGIVELGEMIFSHLIPSIGDISALALTCKQMSLLVQQQVEFWDINLPISKFDEFLNKQTKKFEPQEDESGNVIQANGIRASILVMTRIEQPSQTQNPYAESLGISLKLFDSINTINHSFKHVVFDQLQFFDNRMFEPMVASLPNLETVTISRCELMDVTKLPELIRIIKHFGKKRLESSKSESSLTEDISATSTPATSPTTATQGSVGASAQYVLYPGTLGTPAWDQAWAEVQASKKKADNNYIRLDFSPYYFSGPETKNRLGSYGVTHNEPTFHTPKAVIALTLRCDADAEEIGLDLWSNSSSYFNFLKRLPGPDPLWVIKVREAVITIKDQRSQRTWNNEAEASKMTAQYADDMMAALSGDHTDPYPRDVPHAMMRIFHPNHFMKHWWRNPVVCGVCHKELPRMFFPFKTGRCWGCQLVQFVDDIEDSHARRYQLYSLELLFRGLPRDEATLTKLMDPETRHMNFDAVWTSTVLADKAWKHLKEDVQYLDERGWPAGEDSNKALPEQPPIGMKTSTPSLSTTAITMSNWCWSFHELKQRFDYRNGGPQRQHPCATPPGFSSTIVGGARSKETFTKHWSWTRLTDTAYTRHLYNVCAKDAENRTPAEFAARIKTMVQNAKLDGTYDEDAKEIEYEWVCKVEHEELRWYKNNIEDCVWSLMTPGALRFNHDNPMPNPRLEPGRYAKVVNTHRQSRCPYRGANSWGFY
ncbi:hypothetical protein QBC43DRAFT_348521 [Cladorrhinum sp. PSN259]|nr:hypothetical protein QBC43DRAFT_348521 [Cladorrhinum sp. PSN259]